MSKSKIELGDTAQDPISGVKGVVICVNKWLYGCERLTLQPKGKKDDGAPFENSTYDAPQLKLVKKGVKQKKKDANESGGFNVNPRTKKMN